MKSFLTNLLQLLARLVLRKYKPLIIGITGSVGKTSSKDAVYAVLSSKFSVRASAKNYNNELGVPLTIIGASAPGKSPVKWCVIFFHAVWRLCARVRYPAILVLEMGADHPKDIAKLVALAPPRVGVVTAVAPVHTEFFGNLKRVAVEKRRLVEAVSKEGTVVLNVDDEIVRSFSEYADGDIITYGIKNQEAEFRAVEIVEYLENGTWIATDVDGRPRITELGGVHFKVLHGGSAVPIHLSNVLGHSHVYAALAAAAVGNAIKMNMVEISNALLQYAPPSGRMRLISGVKYTLLIDDTYNASPRAAIAALESLGHLPDVARGFMLRSGGTQDAVLHDPIRYAVLADMRELGQYTESGHREVGRAAAASADVVIGVGVSAQWIVDEAIKSGVSPDRVFHFHSLEDGLEHFLQERIKPGDVILIKGSQGMRMERLVKGLMAEPLRAKELLCRQGKEWEK